MDGILPTSLSYAGLFALVALTACGLPVPEEAVIGAAGVLSSNDQLHIGLAYAACLLGVLVGDSGVYALGYYGMQLSQWRYTIKPENQLSRHIVRLNTLASQRPLYLMLLAHLTIGFRPLVYFTLGVNRTGFASFAASELLCAGAITTVCFGGGYFASEVFFGWFQIIEFGLTTFFVAVALIALVAWLVSRTLNSDSCQPDDRSSN